MSHAARATVAPAKNRQPQARCARSATAVSVASWPRPARIRSPPTEKLLGVGRELAHGAVAALGRAGPRGGPAAGGWPPHRPAGAAAAGDRRDPGTGG